MKAQAFSFTKLVVEDLERSERFYCGIFGMAAIRRHTDSAHAYALDEVMLRLDGERHPHLLILTRYLGRPTPQAGAAWTGFVVSDITATLAAVENAGGRIEVAIHENREHGVLAAIVADPDGHLIETVQILASP